MTSSVLMKPVFHQWLWSGPLISYTPLTHTHMLLSVEFDFKWSFSFSQKLGEFSTFHASVDTILLAQVVLANETVLCEGGIISKHVVYLSSEQEEI